MTIAEALLRARAVLQALDTAALDAEVLLAAVLGRSRTWLHTWPEFRLNVDTLERFNERVSRRANGEPVAYITGTRGFHDIDLAVDASVLIPRPETEELVEFALSVLDGEESTMLDAGTGSGCIALAVARARPSTRITAIELSTEALALARRNAENSGGVTDTPIEWLQGDWYAPVAGRRFHLIVSNPPYVAANDAHLHQGDVRFEPRQALVGGEDGLDAIRTLAAGAPDHLLAGGWIAVEHGAGQGDAVRALFRDAGLKAVSTHADLAGPPRYTTGQRPLPRD